MRARMFSAEPLTPQKILDELTSAYTEIEKTKSLDNTLRMILKHFYFFDEAEIDKTMDEIKAIKLETMPEDLEDGCRKQFITHAQSEAFYKRLVNDETIAKGIRELYDPLLGSAHEEKALEQFDKFIQYFKCQVPANIMSASVWQGGPTILRSPVYHMLDIVATEILKAHHDFLPDREVELSDPQMNCALM